jgi:hypothetical protein
MENKKFNYIEFKMDIVNNELMFLERYLNTKSNEIKVNDLKLIKSTINKLHSILIKSEEQYEKVVNEKDNKTDNKTDRDNNTEIQKLETTKLDIDICKDVSKYNTVMINKVYQINYII